MTGGQAAFELVDPEPIRFIPPQPPAGFVEARYIESDSEPWRKYLMLRSPSGRWQHQDADCIGWVISGAKGTCRHTKELDIMPEQQESTTRALAIFETMDDRAIVARVRGEVTTAWAYRFKTGDQWVEGISIDGVQEIVRRIAGTGEVIREIECALEYENDQEARFLAKAGRFLVRPEGEVLMDTAIRGKRQPKFMQLRAGGTKPDEHWYEKGVAKAVRNAAEALIPEVAKVSILAEARESGRMQTAPQRPQGGAGGSGQARPAPSTGAASGPAPDALVGQRQEILALLREAADTWDGEAFRRLIAQGGEAFPETLNERKQIVPGKISAERAPIMLEWARQNVRPAPPAGSDPAADVGDGESDEDYYSDDDADAPRAHAPRDPPDDARGQAAEGGRDQTTRGRASEPEDARTHGPDRGG